MTTTLVFTTLRQRRWRSRLLVTLAVTIILVAGLSAILIVGNLATRSETALQLAAFLMLGIPPVLLLAGITWRVAEILSGGVTKAGWSQSAHASLQSPLRVALICLVSAAVATCTVLAAHIGVVTPHGVSDAFGAVGGIMPMADTKQYWAAGFNLAHNDAMGHLAARRPIHSIVLSSLFVLNSWSLLSVLFVQASLTGAALGFISVQLGRMTGIGTALVVWSLTFLVIRDYLPTVLSEPTGLWLGFTGIAIILSGFWQKWPISVSLGCGVLLLAFSARSGAYFVVPAVLLAAAWLFRKDWRRITRLVVSAVLLLSLAVAIPRLAGQLYDTSGGTFQGNFAYILYQFSAGSRDWRQIRIDYPEELASRTPEEQYTFIYDKAFDNIREDPLTLLATYVRIGVITAYHLPNKFLDKVARGTGSERILAYFQRIGFLPPFLLFFSGFLTLMCVPGWPPGWRISVFLVAGGFITSLPLIWINVSGGSLRHQSVTFPLVALVIAGILARPPSRPSNRLVKRSEERPIVLGAAVYTAILASLFIPKLHAATLDHSIRTVLTPDDKGRQQVYLSYGPMTPVLQFTDEVKNIIRPDISLQEFNSIRRIQRDYHLFEGLQAGDHWSIGVMPTRGIHRYYRGKVFCMPDRNWTFLVSITPVLPPHMYQIEQITPVDKEGVPLSEDAERPYNCLYGEHPTRY